MRATAGRGNGIGLIALRGQGVSRTGRKPGPVTDACSARRRFALRATLASRTLRSRGAAFAHHAGRAGRTGRALRTSFALRTSRTALASGTCGTAFTG